MLIAESILEIAVLPPAGSTLKPFAKLSVCGAPDFLFLAIIELAFFAEIKESNASLPEGITAVRDV